MDWADMRRTSLHLMAAGIVAAALAGCDDGGCPEPIEGEDRQYLCQWRLFEGDIAELSPARDVVPYTVISNLFTDDARKARFIRVPEGKTIGFSNEGSWTFPVGTVLVKSFGYPEDGRDPDSAVRHIETRLLVQEEPGTWEPHVYRWNDEQTRAERFVPGTRLPISWVDDEGTTREQTYRIPSEEDCNICHGGKEETAPLGPRTRQLNRGYDYGDGEVNQLEHFAQLGLLDQAPPPMPERQTLTDPMGADDLNLRARSYFDANCGHCHRQGGDAQSSGLWLNFENEDEKKLGVCKIPAAAGRGAGGRDFDVVPGKPDESVMIFRMESSEPDIVMPELGGLQNDREGTALIRAWIEQLDAEPCGEL